MKGLFLIIFSTFCILSARALDSPKKVALYADSGNGWKLLDLFLTDASKDDSFLFLERKTVGAILAEHIFAEHSWTSGNIVRVGQILHADIFLLLKNPDANTFILTLFDAKKGVLLSSESFSADVNPRRILALLANTAGRLARSDHIRIATLLSVRNIDLPGSRFADCHTYAEQLPEMFEACSADIVFVASQHLGYVNRERFLSNLRESLFSSHVVIYADFFRGENDQSFRLELTIRSHNGRKRTFIFSGEFGTGFAPEKLYDAVAFILETPADHRLDPKREAKIYFDEYKLTRAKGLGTLHQRLRLYDAAVAYDPEHFLGKHYLEAIYFTAQSFAPRMSILTSGAVDIAKQHLDLLEYYTFVYDEIIKTNADKYPFAPDDGAIFGTVSPNVLEYWNYSPGGWTKLVPAIKLPSDIIERARTLHVKLYEIKKSQSRYDDFIALKERDPIRVIGNLVNFPCFSEKEYYERFLPLMDVLVGYAELYDKENRVDILGVYSWWNQMKYRVRHAKEEQSEFALSAWRYIAEKFSTSSARFMHLWGIMLKNEIGEYYRTPEAFRAAMFTEVSKTFPALVPGSARYNQYQKTIQEINANTSGMLIEIIAQLAAAADEYKKQAQMLAKVKITRDNYREIETQLKHILTKNPKFDNAREQEDFKMHCISIEHRLRRFKVSVLYEKEVDFPFEVKVEKLWPQGTEGKSICDVACYGGDPECWLLYREFSEKSKFTIRKLNLALGHAEVVARFPEYNEKGNPPRLLASPDFVALIHTGGNTVAICEIATGETRLHQLPFDKILAAAILNGRLYAWFDQEQCLVDFELPSMKWVMISSHASRDSETHQTSGMSAPHSYMAFADPKRNQVFFAFDIYRVQSGPKRPGGFWIYSPETKKLTWSGFEPHNNFIASQPLWLSPDTATICRGNAIYHLDLAENRLTLPCWFVSSAHDTSQLSWLISRHPDIFVGSIFGYGIFSINEFYNKLHLPHNGWLWGTSGMETPFDVIELATGKIHYIEIPEIKGRSLYFRATPAGDMFCFTSDGVYRIQVEKKH